MNTWAQVLAELEAEADEFEASLAANRALAPQAEWVPPQIDTPPTEADRARIEALLRRQQILQERMQKTLSEAPALRQRPFASHTGTSSEPSLLDRSA